MRNRDSIIGLGVGLASRPTAGLCVALLLTCSVMMSATVSYAEESPSKRRMTPLVKALGAVKASAVNIHSEKTTYDKNPLFDNGKGRKVNGMGTGVIVDERGYIATNHHVVKDVDSLRVTLFDGSTYTAHVVSFDRKHDLALIKINSTKALKVMQFGTSSDLMLGESVFAIGNAFGYEHTVTSGIVSSLSRDVEVNEEQSYENLIQTDASINPGNSGGPLLNLDGEVIGINVAIRAGAQRIGFAIPIDDARKIIAQLLSIERLNSTQHGLLTRDFKKGTTRMLVVNSASPNTPAGNAGFLNGDIINQVGTLPVVDAADFERALLGRQPGETVTVKITRGNEELEKSITVARLTNSPHGQAVAQNMSNTTIVRGNNDPVAEKAWRILGVKLSPMKLTAAQIEGANYRGGMLVANVRPGSPAAKNGIQQGDVLVGLHLWETVTHDNISYVLDHPQLRTFNPLKFYILRGRETLYGHLQVSLATR